MKKLWFRQEMVIVQLLYIHIYLQLNIYQLYIFITSNEIHQLHLLIKNKSGGTSLVAQWLRIRLPMQGTWVWSLLREDPTCHGATKPVRHNYWAGTPQLLKPMHSRASLLQLLRPCAASTEAHAPRARAPQQEKPPQWEARTPQQRVAPTRCN